MKPISVLLVILILASGFTQPPAKRMKMSMAEKCLMMKHAAHKGGCCEKNKKSANALPCNYCMLCFAFIIPVKPELQRNFASKRMDYPDMVQSKLTDFKTSLWRPPNA